MLDGTTLGETIGRIDNKIGDNSTPRYAVNCVHPRILHKVLDNNSEIEGRIISFRGNTSDLSAAELNGFEELITEEPGRFAVAHKELLSDHDIKIIGGCCSTTPDHIRAIAGIL